MHIATSAVRLPGGRSEARGTAGPLACLLVSLSLLAACTRGAPPPAATLPLTACRLEGVSQPLQCGTVEVWEDRAKKEGRRLKLKVAVARSLAAQPAPDPLFVLAGGPGQSATGVAGGLLPALEKVRRTRDIVFVDQRGTGGSNPLACEGPEDVPLEERLRTDVDHAELKKCLEGYDADVRHYGTTAAMQDLDEVREALGYAQVSLYGGSYGTRAGLEYARRFPTRVRAMVLDGVAPMSLYLPLSLARDAQRALDQLFADCAAEPRCAKAYPDLPRRFEALLADLSQGPKRVRVAHPVSGRPHDVDVSRELVTASLRALLYAPDASTNVPQLIDRAAAGDFGPLLATAGQVGAAGSMSMGLFLSVMCTEDAPFVTAADVAREAEGTWLGAGMGQRMLESCTSWRRGEVPADFREPVKSDVPTLLLSGALDPVTPPAHAEAAARTLTRSLHVTLPAVGHGTVTQPCVRELMRDFLERGDVQGLTHTCPTARARPPFFLGFAADPVRAQAGATPTPAEKQVTR